MSKRSVIQTNDGYLMLLDAVYFNGRRMGNISEEGLDWGGEDAQTVEGRTDSDQSRAGYRNASRDE